MDETSLNEKKKYERMWAHRDYAKWSPGEEIAPFAFKELCAHAGQSIIDYGCGKGQAVAYFRDRGMFARGVDLVPLFPAAIIASLWELPDSLLPADFAFSADVFEHIPTDKIDATLAGIALRTKEAGFFRISTREDSMGRLIGKKLHLTVQPVGWWKHKLLQFFDIVRLGPCERDESSFWAHVRK